MQNQVRVIAMKTSAADTFLSRHPFLSFAAIAYGISWSAWVFGLTQGEGTVATLAHYSGGFGPLLAGLIMVVALGRNPWAWAKGLLKWRVAPRWYVFVLGWPVLLVAITSVLFVGLGYRIDLGLVPERLASYAPVFLVMALIGGGNEEPGWRGFALPTLQDRLSPLRATLLLGIVWAFWHLPLLWGDPAVRAGEVPSSDLALRVGLLLVSITAHAFWYTWLMNRTGSVLLCLVLHAGYNTANGLLVLVPEAEMHGAAEEILLPLMTGVVVASVIMLIVATRGRLGKPA